MGELLREKPTTHQLHDVLFSWWWSHRNKSYVSSTSTYSPITTETFVCDFSSQFNFFQHFYVEFTQPATCVSHTVLRSVSILNGSGEPPEKFAKYLARQEYKLEIEFADKEESSYKVAAKQVKKAFVLQCPKSKNPKSRDHCSRKPLDSGLFRTGPFDYADHTFKRASIWYFCFHSMSNSLLLPSQTRQRRNMKISPKNAPTRIRIPTQTNSFPLGLAKSLQVLTRFQAISRFFISLQ